MDSNSFEPNVTSIFVGVLLKASQNLRAKKKQQGVFYQNHFERITSLINETTALYWDPWNPTYNFGPFKDALDNLYNVPVFPENNTLKGPPQLNASQFILWKDICGASKAFQEYHSHSNNNSNSSNNSYPPLPHVLVTKMNENWGEFSKEIPGKTAAWEGTDEEAWKREGCSVQDIFNYLNHNDTRAVVTTQFQAFDHPKVHSLPLGVQSIDTLQKILRRLQQQPPTNNSNDRTQLLMLNHQPRTKMRGNNSNVDGIIDKFQKGGISVRNTYPHWSYGDYLAELRSSKFILSPSGMGLDCYRHWEALYMGTIPVIEHLNRTDGWYRTLEGLPVAWIDSNENLTPQFLQDEYKRIIGSRSEAQKEQQQAFQYEKLTKQWWIQKVKATLRD